MMKFADLFTFSNYENRTFYNCILLQQISNEFKIGDKVNCIYYNPEDNTLQLTTYSQWFKVKIELMVTSIGNLEMLGML